MSIRDEIRELCIAHDRFMAEQESDAIQRPPVCESDDAGLVYKTHDNNEPAPAAADDGDWSGWEAWLRAHLDNERAVFTEALAEVISELRKEWRAEHAQALTELARKFADLRAENAELKGMLAATLTLLGQHAGDSTKAANVVDLPNWRRGHGAA
jgi:hypothetical protein